MATRLVNLDRQTPMFLPCDLCDWVPDGHIVHFVLDAVEQLPTHHFAVNRRGTGSEQYPPTMMLALVIYCYAYVAPNFLGHGTANPKTNESDD
ncbi:MAG: hypothetical protein RLZZ15_434 [Verrucomicrobiota bacterium]|jgi:transposase